MKVRWREHELIFVTFLIGVYNIMPLLFKTTNWPSVSDIETGFRQQGIPFEYWRNILLPQLGVIALICFGYCSVNFLILPLLKKISFDDVEKFLSLRTGVVILAIAGVSYLLALGINVCSYFAQPHLFNYAGYGFLPLGGYNDKPLTNYFFGFDRVSGMVILFTALTGLREIFIWLINKPGPKREYRIVITNNITSLTLIFLLLLLFTNPIHHDFVKYTAWIIPAFVLYIYFTFWLFPQKGENSFLHRPFLVRLLASTLSGTLLHILLVRGYSSPLLYFLYWIFLLFVVTSFCWLLYQLRKDKIMQLAGMETALAKSTADLAFLRSQVNPHFLFNTLNTLYGTALKEDAEHTAKGIQKLGDMMRFILHENNRDVIPMDKEIEYLKNYIALQKLRIRSSPDIHVEDNIDEVKCNRTIAPMLLIPLVENAFKHGISLKEKSWITIMLDCSSKAICFEVRNSIHVLTGSDTEQGKSGIGLKNVTERLKLLYPNRHELSIGDHNNEFVVRLVIKDN